MQTSARHRVVLLRKKWEYWLKSQQSLQESEWAWEKDKALSRLHTLRAAFLNYISPSWSLWPLNSYGSFCLGSRYKVKIPIFFFFKEMFLFFLNLFIYLWLCWVFVSVRGLSPVAASGGHSSSRCAGLTLSRPLLLRSTGSRRTGSVIVAHGPSCSAACGIFPDQGSNPCSLHWQADSQPLRHQGSPKIPILTHKNWYIQDATIFFKGVRP